MGSSSLDMEMSDMSKSSMRSRDHEASIHSEGISYDRDELELARVGKRQLLKRRFGLLSITAFSCTLMGTWEGVFTGLVFGLQNGGPAGLLYNFLLAWVGSLSISIALGELSSMFPTAGGQYYWASILAPRRAKKFVSYIVGWTTMISWVAATGSQCSAFASMTQAVITANDPSYNAKGWQGTLIMWAVLLLLVLLTTVLGRVLPTLEVVLMLLHILGFLGTMIPLVYYAPAGHASDARAREIFTTFFNLGGWKTQALSFFVGIQGNALAFIGTDGAVHMCEEVERSSVTVAQSMILATVINGLMGFAIILSVLFSVDNVESLSQLSGPFPYLQLLAERFDSTGAATAIASLIVFMIFATTVAVMSSSSRMIWSFARDRGLPGWKSLKKVDTRSSIPANTVYTTAVVIALLGLINIVSTTAFEAMMSLTLEGFSLSYLLVLSLLLYRRVRGQISEPRRNWFVQSIEPADLRYTWGPWSVKGWFGLLNNTVAVLYLIVVCFFSFWPSTVPVKAPSMNYSVVVLGAVIIGSIGWYFFKGRKEFSGPLIEVRIVEETPVHHAKDR